jgi:Flp pilus assembly protein TadG
MISNLRKIHRPRKNRIGARTGALTVEMALCLPILLLVLFGCYEIAKANMMLHASEAAAYEGARVGIVPGATPEKIEAAVGGVLRSMGISSFTVDVTPNVISTNTEQIEVEVGVPFLDNTLIAPFFMDDSTFRSRCELSRETL